MSDHLSPQRTICAIAFVSLSFLAWTGLRDANAATDPCEKEKIAASKRNAPPSAINQLRECRNRQKAKTANPPPWARDGGASDDEYVRVPCPPGLPKWRVCEKKRSELMQSPDGGA